MSPRLLMLVIVVLVLGGCGSTSPLPTYGSTHEVEEAYRPLKTLSERPNLFMDADTLSTVGEIVYVGDLKKWLAAHPPGTPLYRAPMLHEQEHARRQIASGNVTSWVARYLTDADFMWSEEQRGWYYQIKTLRDNGYNINVDAAARALHNYKTLTGSNMVSIDDARAWVLSVLNGQWKPSD